MKRFALLAVCLIGTISLQAQQYLSEIQGWLHSSKDKFGLTDQDIRNFTISDQYSSQQSGLTYTYLQQQIEGTNIHNAISTMALREGKVVHFANRFYANAREKANTTVATLTPEMAIQAAAAHLGLSLTEDLVLRSQELQPAVWIFSGGGIAQEKIVVKPVYVATEHSFQLAWNVNLDLLANNDWWNIRIDAGNGSFIEKNNWTMYCSFDNAEAHNAAIQAGQHTCAHAHTSADADESIESRYNVFPYPIEAPTFGQRSIVTDNGNTASPFGWHDVNGADGAEYTITRGNNVYAYDDAADTNQPGYSPDGGATLNFDFPLDLTQEPAANRDAILTNLFYTNNRIHDVLYYNGFDESAGNFQQNNYGKGGLGGDYVEAEGQDGGGTNNANFATPEDGSNGRMQMYLWSGTTPIAPTQSKINSPDSLAGEYTVLRASFGPGIPQPITADLVLAIDTVGPATDACSAIVNAAQLAGKIAILDRGTCGFPTKVMNAQNAGAIAVVVVNTATGTFLSMPGSGTGITIPSVMISFADGNRIKASLQAGGTVNMTLSSTPVIFGTKDGSLDNGVIAHEYGHGLSTRLTGGPSNSNCLSNQEQGGEGWSDWLALIMTIEPGDTGAAGRGIGTYASSQPVTGGGIRRFRYSTDMGVNSQTYKDIQTGSVPHGVGEIWCDVVWDLTWKLIDAEGFTSDWASDTGGNITAMRLVIEGMKLQPCGPGYIDARDAILAADDLLYNGAHKCMIWEVFARRGMGWKAKQGSSNEIGDETEDFKIPPACQTAIVAPTANFAADTSQACFGIFSFTDLSTDIAQQWLWDFGDGNISTEIDPKHRYATPGTYTVLLTVTNTLGSDTYSAVVTYGLPAAPSVSGNTNVCAGNTTILKATVNPGNTAIWRKDGEVVFSGTAFQTPVLLETTTYSVVQSNPTTQGKVGPANNSFGTGGNHNTTFEGRLIFEAFAPFNLKSVLVYAQGAGPRTILVYNEANEIIHSKTVVIPNGESRVTLDFDIAEAGTYSLANDSENLYRNNAGANYPYALGNLVSIIRSNSTNNELTFYYYFYDWEVEEIGCASGASDITIGVTPGPVAQFSSTANFLAVTFTDNTSALATNWSWNFGDGSPLSTEQNPSHTYAAPGTYLVALTVSDGSCFGTYSQELSVSDSSSSTLNLVLLNNVSVYPNPATQLINIEFKNKQSQDVDLWINDARGALIQKRSYSNSNLMQVSTEGMSAGVYYVRIVTKEGVAVKKVSVLK